MIFHATCFESSHQKAFRDPDKLNRDVDELDLDADVLDWNVNELDLSVSGHRRRNPEFILAIEGLQHCMRVSALALCQTLPVQESRFGPLLLQGFPCHCRQACCTKQFFLEVRYSYPCPARRNKH
jgi:hypothetical protein